MNQESRVPDRKRIAVEEAYASPELVAAWEKVIRRNPAEEVGFVHLISNYFSDDPGAQKLMSKLTDIGAQRMAEMDEHGITKHLLSITAPGVQPLDTDTAISVARVTNDRRAEAVLAHPDRFDALTAVAPQAPELAARELERGMNELGFKGFLINSHTRGEYLDDKKYWCIFEAAEALGAPLYLHPRTPSPQMIDAYLPYGLESATWGFAAESSLHIMRMIMGGVFDRFPDLMLVAGHAGEGLPFWLDRIDDRYGLFSRLDKVGRVPKLERKPSEYIRQNMYITTSGMNFESPLLFVISEMGADRVLYAADYPYESMKTREAVDALDISDEDKTKIFSGNAERVFSMD